MGLGKHIGALCVVGALIAVQPWTSVAAEPQVEFSADSVTESGGAVLKEKVYYAPGRVRKELEIGHGKQIEITRLDKKVAWLLMTEEKLYLERALTQTDELTLTGTAFEQTAVGEELLDGIPTTKYQAVARQADGAGLSGFLWTTKEGITLKMDLKTDGVGGGQYKTELKNLKIGKQAASLFEIPSGYKKFTLGGFEKGARP